MDNVNMFSLMENSKSVCITWKVEMGVVCDTKREVCDSGPTFIFPCTTITTIATFVTYCNTTYVWERKGDL